MNYIDKLIAGEVTHDDIDDYVDEWHFMEADPGCSLQEYLGFTECEYAAWVVSHDVLPIILSIRNGHFDTERYKLKFIRSVGDETVNVSHVCRRAIRDAKSWLLKPDCYIIHDGSRYDNFSDLQNRMSALKTEYGAYFYDLCRD